MAVIKYGYVKGTEVTIDMPVAASEVFKHLSGCFVEYNSAGRVAVAGATSTDLAGWAYTGEYTASATAGNTRVPVNVAFDAVYRMPLETAYTEAQLLAVCGKFCDIAVTSNVQYANPGGTSINIIQVVGYEYYGSAAGQQAVLVKLVPKNLTTAA